MKLIGYTALFLSAVILCSGQSSTGPDATTAAAPGTTQNSTTKEPPKTSSPDPITTTSVAPETTQSPTTAAPTTTTTTTPVPTSSSTTSEAPQTTQSPTTTSPGDTTPVPTSSSTTSEAPGTTTSSPATSPEPPTPAPPVKDLKFVVNNSGNACILANMEITLQLNLTEENGTQKIMSYDVVNADVLESESSNCSSPDTDSKEIMIVQFADNNTLTFVFSRESDKVTVGYLTFHSDDIRSIFPNATSQASVALYHNASFFETTNQMSYVCKADTSLDLTTKEGQATGSKIVLRKVQVEAFRKKEDGNFANARDCVADDNVSDIVPIAVGCALAGLVVIVLIAYLVGRRQKRQRGYESV